MSGGGHRGYERSMTTRQETPVVEPWPAPAADERPAAPRATWASVTDIGNVREVNEDSLFVSEELWVVADGMGGHEAGDVASQLATEACRDAVAGGPLTIDRLAELIADANRRVRAYATAHDSLGMGCTMVGAALIDNGGTPSVVVFNIGDARCYRVGDGELCQVTTDHSYVQELVEAGELAPDDALSHPQRNVVTRAIGIEPKAAADFVVLPAAEGMVRLLLCSDGVHGELPADRLRELVAGDVAPEAVVEVLRTAVLDGRGADNLTAVVVDIVLPPPRPVGVPAGSADETTGPRRRGVDGTTRPRRRRPMIDEVPR